MKHYFVLNPIAGHRDATELLKNKIHNLFLKNNEEHYLYVTKGPNDATIMIKKLCTENETSAHPEDITFYICGGDGTCFEGVNGVVGFPHARMTIVPIGSCNDFLKNFPELDFMDLEALIKGEERLIDVLKVNERYSLNVANIGYDAKVNYDCVRFRYKYKTVKQSYDHALVRNLLKPLGDMVTITADGKEVFHKKALLMAFGNGSFYGGGYKCAPYAKCDDGLIEMVVVKKVGILTFARLVKFYKAGTHLDQAKLRKLITYQQVKEVNIKGEKELTLCLDGETFHMKEVNISIIPKAIRFVFPTPRKLK